MRSAVRVVAAALATVLVVGLAGCSNKDVAARVNGEVIKLSDVNAQVEATKKQYPQMFGGTDGEARIADFRKRIIDTYVQAALVRQDAKKRGVKVSEAEIEKTIDGYKKGFKTDKEFEAAITKAGYTIDKLRQQVRDQLLTQKVIEKVTAENKVTDAQVKAYYEKNKARYKQEAAVHAAHILFDEKDKANAQKVLAQVKSGGDFAALAKKNSKDPGSATRGGDLGWPTSPFVKEFQDAANKLKPGQVSELVHSPFGWHIIKVIETRGAKQLTLKEAESRIRAELKQQAQADAYGKYVQGLRKNAKIEVISK